MRKKQLSKRLMAVANLVTAQGKPYSKRVADVGCDHAYVSIYLVENGIADYCLAMDINEGPLERARKNIAVHGLEDRIETRLGAGLSQVRPGEVDTVLMAGMGGILTRDILRENVQISGSLQEWVLQPQSDIWLVRRYIREAGFRIEEEDIVKEDGKYYPMFRAVPIDKSISGICSSGLEEVYDRFGELLLKRKNPVLREFLEYGREHYTNIVRGMQPVNQDKKDGNLKERFCHMEQELAYIERALKFYQEE